MLLDMENGIFANSENLHATDFEDRYFGALGPLTAIPSPQHRRYLF